MLRSFCNEMPLGSYFMPQPGANTTRYLSIKGGAFFTPDTMVSTGSTAGVKRSMGQSGCG
jgi:hypothetical protein